MQGYRYDYRVAIQFRESAQDMSHPLSQRISQVSLSAKLEMVYEFPQTAFISAARSGGGIVWRLAQTISAHCRRDTGIGSRGLQRKAASYAPGFLQPRERSPAGQTNGMQIESRSECLAEKAMRGKDNGEDRFSEPFGESGLILSQDFGPIQCHFS
jgi:hypothetical protein